MASNKLKTVVSALETSRDALSGHIHSLDQAQLDRSPSEEKWSVGEVLHHLILVDMANKALLNRLVEREKKHAGKAACGGDAASVQNDPVVLPKDIANLITTFPVFSGASPQQGLERNYLLKQLKQTRAAIMKIAEATVGNNMSNLSFPHPVLGRLDFYQWLLFLSEHERGHTKQIIEILEESNLSIKADM